MNANKKSLTYILAFLLFFAAFIFILLRPSAQSKAIKEINTCENIEDIKAIWYKYKSQFADNSDYCQAVRTKLNSLGLKPSEITNIKKWLPSETGNLNIIVVADLSHRRLLDNKNQPTAQVNDDKIIINKIWDEFQSKVRLKQDPKDRFFIDVIDDGQANEFKNIADSMVVDLKNSKKQQTRTILNRESIKIKGTVDKLYSLALKSTAGADFGIFFNQKLPFSKRIMKSNLDDNYRNILIILSDGVYETGKYPNGKIDNNFQQYLKSLSLANIPPPVGEGFSNLEAYIFEINPPVRNDLYSVRNWWEKWFIKLGFANSEDKPVHIHEPTTQLTLDAIQDIFR